MTVLVIAVVVGAALWGMGRDSAPVRDSVQTFGPHYRQQFRAGARS